jgi:hypothetical protein
VAIQRVAVDGSESQEVGVPRRPVREIEPQVEKQRTLQQVMVASRRDREAIQEPLEPVARQDEIEILAPLPCPREQAGVDRRREVRDQVTASR